VYDLIVQRIDPTLPLPTYAREGDSGFDLRADDDYVLNPHKAEKIGTGLLFHIPEGYEVQIRPRSSMSSIGLPAQFGTVDNGYRGEVSVILANLNEGTRLIRKGDRIAQAVLAPVTRANIVEGAVSTDTERGCSGFGSTGR